MILKDIDSKMEKEKGEERERCNERLNVSADMIFRDCATTLCRSTWHWSFGKADRFKQPKTQNQADFCVLPSTLNKRSAGFGYGARSPMINRQGNDSPSPTKYNLKSLFENPTPNAPSFGSLYLNVKSPIEKFPGPGSYNVSPPLGLNAPKFTLKGRIETKIRNQSPPPTAYNPSPVRSNRYGGIGIGIGNRTFLNNRSLSSNPGPGSYEVQPQFNTNGRTSAMNAKWGSRMTAITKTRENMSL